MKGYFARKPENIQVVKDTVAEAKAARFKPVKINAVEKVIVSLDEYIRFCDNLLQDWEFLKPYTETARFTGDYEADCVLVGAPGQRYVAVCLEGYSYARYAAWAFAD